jgi:hypothetical protein
MAKNPEMQDNMRDVLVQKLEQIAWLLEQARRGTEAGGVRLTGLNVKIPAGLTGESTVVVKGVTSEGVRLVAFQSADDVVTAWLRGLSKWWSCDLKWREDEYTGRNAS